MAVGVQPSVSSVSSNACAYTNIEMWINLANAFGDVLVDLLFGECLLAPSRLADWYRHVEVIQTKIHGSKNNISAL